MWDWCLDNDCKDDMIGCYNEGAGFDRVSYGRHFGTVFWIGWSEMTGCMVVCNGVFVVEFTSR